jgi:ribonuclease BN (tRNA processing enzyme)
METKSKNHNLEPKKIIWYFGTEIQESLLGTENQDLGVRIEIQESRLGTKNQDSVVKCKMEDLQGQTKNLEDPIGIENYTIRSKTKNILPIEIRDSKQGTKILDLMNIGQILDSKYPIADTSIVELVVNVVDGKSMDGSRNHLLASIGTFCLFVEMVSNEK